MSLVGPIKERFETIKSESCGLSKQQHLADFFSWGTKHGIRDETLDSGRDKGRKDKGDRNDNRLEGIKQEIGPGRDERTREIGARTR